MTLRTWSFLALVLSLLGSSGCIPRVRLFERFTLNPGQVDVLWTFVDERLHRCVNLPKGPVCARVTYPKGAAETEDLASVAPTPPPIPGVAAQPVVLPPKGQ